MTTTSVSAGRRIGSLFSGIGGLELGLERAGVGHVAWQVELDPFARAVLAKHWPDATRFEDVRTVGAHNLEPVDVVCGGFPCQDISSAGKKAGIRGAQSFLWREFARILRELRPRVAVIENAAVLVHRGLDLVLRDLAVLGFDAEWTTLSACAVGAPHMRRRLYLVAYADVHREPVVAVDGEVGRVPADAGALRSRWVPEPSHLRVADGLPGGLDARRLHALGNAVVPAVAEAVGRRVMEFLA
jgi:DNA (cytosine-5)-methyltransferase 1